MLNNLLLGQTAEEKLYVEDVFSTYLYTGTSAAQTITNGIDLAGKGGMVWLKHRSGTPESGYEGHFLFDTVRGNTVALSTDKTNSNQAGWGNQYFRFQSTGFDFGTGDASYQVYLNKTGASYASWSFRKAAKFFDIVTWTGNATARDISHSLGVSPGLIIIKRTDAVAQWPVWHRSLPANNTLFLNTTDNTQTASGYVTSVSANTFSIGTSGNVNATGGSYIAYLFAHDTTADGVIQCGSFTTDGTGNATVSLGWEPQFVIVKTSTTGAWSIFDVMRGFSQTQSNELNPNYSAAETANSGNYFVPTATGFRTAGWYPASTTVLYLAIRRGPMRTPTDATKVFKPTKQTTTGFTEITGVGFAPDIVLQKATGSDDNWDIVDKLRGPFVALRFNSTNAETATDTEYYLGGWTNDGVKIGTSTGGQFNGWNPNNLLFLRRAPGFFDIVCYTGDGTSSRQVNHNLGVSPELVISRARSSANDWRVVASAIGFGTTDAVALNSNAAKSATSRPISAASTTTITLDLVGANVSGTTYVTYLFASCPGVSKVGSYTGTGTTKQIDCGFTNGARFVLIKRTDSTGDWTIWDTARGIVSGNDPYLLLNSTAAEVTNTDYIDPLSTGFEISSTAPAAINANGGTFVFLAIA